MSRGGALILGTIVFLAVMTGLLWRFTSQPTTLAGGGSLRLYCAAGMKPVIEAVADAYQEAHDVTLEIQYGGSGTLLSQLTVRPEGVDLYLAADDSYTDRAHEQGLVAEIIPLALMRPVIVVRAGSDHRVANADDLLRDDLTVALANPDAAAIGRVTRDALTQAGLWDRLQPRVKVFKPTVMEVANDVLLGAVDAGVVWDTTVALYPDLEAVHDPRLDAAVRTVTIGIVAASTQPERALHFARFLSAPEHGGRLLREHSFEPIIGDAWSDHPELILYAGSMFNQAIETTLREFEAREGMSITRVYNGCGILVGQMRTGGRPDAYLACDTTFMDAVGDLFDSPTDLTANDLVLVTAPGNPLDVASLDDLPRPGLRVGLAHPEKSALGHLTRNLLVSRGLDERLAESGNVRQDAPQGDFLVNALRTGSLDAVVAYRSNAILAGDAVTVVALDTDAARAVQPYAVARESAHRHAAARLRDALVSSHTRDRFRDLGFRWVHPDGATTETEMQIEMDG